MKGFPCHECGDRYPGCHVCCLAYRMYKKRRDSLILAYREQQRGYRSAISQAVDGAARARRRAGKKG